MDLGYWNPDWSSPLTLYNSSFNLSSTFHSLLSWPSRVISKVRRFDDLLNNDFENHALTTTAMQSNTIRRMHPDIKVGGDIIALPGPWAFITSGYAVGLLLMALILNRIHHVVAPPRQTLAYRIIRSRRSLMHAVFYHIFPINLSSATFRLIFRIPSLYYLFKSLLLLSATLLQVSGLYPSWDWSLVDALSSWADSKEMADVCWAAFCSVCLALTITALTRGLEGHEQSNSPPFNLFGYAFLLHIYSVPISHSHRGPPSRPDMHVLITIILPLLQLCMTHALEVNQRWSRQRLVPTTICSLLTLLHFHCVLFTSPTSYPVLNYLPCLLDTFLILVTLLTCTLNALTQLLLEGEIRHPLIGHTRTLLPKWDEDFGMALLRLGTACLEATSVAGLGNEVGGIAVTNILHGGTEVPVDDAFVELNRSGVATLSDHNKSRKRRFGYANEIKHVKVAPSDVQSYLDNERTRALTRLGLSLLAIIKGTWRYFLWTAWYRWWRSETPWRPGQNLETSEHTVNITQQMQRFGTPEISPNTEDYLYDRFLANEPISDGDDDDEYDPSRDHAERESTPVSDTETEDFDGERAELYSDLLDDTSSPTLLAHMLSPSSSHLTRRRYTQFISSSRPSFGVAQDDAEWENISNERRTEKAPRKRQIHDTYSESNRNCVICATEPRDIILWPCRCLALCNDCRENLASRFPSSKHNCPCCRQTVKGFSKIFIP